jgi:DNA adenine methylase
MYAAAQRLRNVYIDNMEAEYCISYYDTPDALFYVDPPYIETGKGYAMGMDEGDHESLLDLLLDVEGYVVLSCLENDLYHDVLGSNGWIVETFRTKTMKNKHNIEAIWMNYE